MPKPLKTSIAFLPGFGFQAGIFTALAHQLKDSEIILCDLPKKPLTKKTPALSLHAVAEEINAQLPDPCLLIAWSLGGIISSHLCQSYPDKYQKRILFASSPQFVSSGQWLGISSKIAQQFLCEAQTDFQTLMQKFQALAAKPLLVNDYGNLQTYAWLKADKNLALFYLQLLLQNNCRAIEEQLQVPTLRFFGTQDAVLPYPIAVQIKKTYPRQECQFLPGAGHLLFLSHQSFLIDKIVAFVCAAK
jgi:pimeloyl-[acyl-carrier protein] methyl ester esterase